MSKVVLNSVVLGQSGTASNNFLLDTDAAGALRIRRNADGSGGSVLTVNSAGTLVQPAQSMVRLDTQNGNGSTNTRIPRFTNVRTNQGSDITYTDSATGGASFTINTAGVYAISFTFSAGASEAFAITLNESAGTLNSLAALVAVSEILQFCDSPSVASAGALAWTGYLAAGSVIRPHTGGGNSSSPRFMFTITRVA